MGFRILKLPSGPETKFWKLEALQIACQSSKCDLKEKNTQFLREKLLYKSVSVWINCISKVQLIHENTLDFAIK